MSIFTLPCAWCGTAFARPARLLAIIVIGVYYIIIK